MEKHIEIEKMLFGDYRVEVYNGLSSCLDRAYFCRGYLSALMTANLIRTLEGFENLPIYLRDMGELRLINEVKKSTLSEF